VPAALRERAFALLKDLESVDRDEAALRADEAWALVDLCGYMLALRMTEAAAVSFCAALLVCIRLNQAAGGVAERTAPIERLFERCRQVLQLISEGGSESDTGRKLGRRGSLLICNVIACMSEFESPFHLDESELCDLLEFDPNAYTEEQYFEFVTVLFYCSHVKRPYAEATAATARLEGLVKEIGLEHAGVAHAVFDALACPLISIEARRNLLRTFAAELSVSMAFISTNTEADRVIQRFERHGWFAPWDSRVPLLQQVRRRTARRMY
jgi:hypothetical protein